MSFDILDRAAAGRLGRFRTNHGNVTTPTLMPVINPNIDLVPASEMRDRFGCEMIITNSYVIHKHERLRNAALEHGIHELVNWDGAIMTDSGTFQMYVYGDVEVGPQDIVRFQADMGVDVATCLDLFVTPDMSREEAEQAVATTLERTRDAALMMRGSDGASGHDPEAKSLINATVQGGTNLDLRQACAAAYRELPVEYHTIGGVVPVMERQMYPELVEMILASQQHLRKDRPVHLFGAGHPLVFPIATALGCDLFDSSSYAKYAKDGRMMWEGGTYHIEDLAEWPISAPMLDGWTPQELTKALKSKGRRAERAEDSELSPAQWAQEAPKRIAQREADDPHFAAERALALHNLEVCFTDLRRIRSAIRDGTLWELVEQRAACHPLLAAATRRLGNPEHQQWLERREPLAGSLGQSKALRYTGGLTHRRPVFARIRDRLQTRYGPTGDEVESEFETPYAKVGDMRKEIAMHKETSKPFSYHAGTDLDPDQDHVVINALGPTPLGLDEAYPFAQSVLPSLDGLDREHMGWVGDTKDAVLETHGMMPAIPGPPGPDGGLDRDRLHVLHTADWQFGKGAGAALVGGDMRYEHSRKTSKLRTVHRDGQHILSLRAEDGLWTLKPAGARLLHSALPAPSMRVTVHDDSVAFNREGKSVFSQFVLHCDPSLRPGDECLVVDEKDSLVAVGRCVLMDDEMADFQHGAAVKVRDGLPAASS